MHVDGTAAALRRLGHHVTILAPSSRARDLLGGRRALQHDLDGAEVIAVGPSIPLSRRTNMGVPVAVRANLRLALAKGEFDVVHGFEPGLPSVSYLALTSTRALTAATFFSVDRLGYPARRSRRDRLRARVDALLATSAETAEAASERFEGEYAVVPLASTSTCSPRPRSGTSLVDRARAGSARRRARCCGCSRSSRLGGHAAPHEAPRVPARDPAIGPRARPRPRHANQAQRAGRARPCRDLRFRAGWRGPARARGRARVERCRRRTDDRRHPARRAVGRDRAAPRPSAADAGRRDAETAELRRGRGRARSPSTRD